MSRVLSSAALAAIYAQETSEAMILLVTIDHEKLSTPARVCANGADIVSRGNTFVAVPFEFTLPDDVEDAAPRAKLRIDNLNRDLLASIRAILSPPTVLMEIILASSPDTVEISFPNLEFANVTYNVNVIEGDIVMDGLIQEPFPGIRYVPSQFPGIF